MLFTATESLVTQSFNEMRRFCTHFARIPLGGKEKQLKVCVEKCNKEAVTGSRETIYYETRVTISVM